MSEPNTITILFLLEPEEELLSYLKQGLKEHSRLNFTTADKENEENLKQQYSQADIIIGWMPSHENLKQADNLKLFINPGAGVKHLIEIFKDVTQAREIALVNGHGNSYFTAQHAVALLLALTNKVIPHHNWMMEGKWRLGDNEAASIPLRDRKIGLLGYGAVNRKVHKFLSGFDVEFHILKTSWSESDRIPGTKYNSPQLHEFLTAIDTLIIAVPQTAETAGMIKENELKLLGKSGLLVNVGRGDVIDEESLYNALMNKVITGAAIDVWYNYKPEEIEGKRYPYKYPFYELDNIILSPHRAASPFDDLKRWHEVIENIKRFADGRTDFLNLVSLEKGY
jgi:phosphoglycerate dehydrogenase-like enzyme